MITEKMYLEAISQKNRIDFEISPTKWVSFGTVGVTISQYSKRTVKEKHINYWKKYSVKELNEKFKEIEWEKVI